MWQGERVKGELGEQLDGHLDKNHVVRGRPPTRLSDYIKRIVTN